MFRRIFSRQMAAIVAVLLSFLLLVPAGAEAQDICPTCYDECSWWLLMSFCSQIGPGLVGYCRCKERPCVADGIACTYIFVTP